MDIRSQYGQYFDALARHGKVRPAAAEAEVSDETLKTWRLSPHFTAAEKAIKRLAEVPEPTKRRWTPGIAARITRALESGSTLVDACRAENIAVNTVYEHLDENPRIAAALRGRYTTKLTPEALARGAELLRQGQTATEVAAALGVQPPILSRAAKRHPEFGAVYNATVGRPHTKRSPESDERFKARCAAGATDAELVQEFRVSVHTVKRWRRELT